MVCSNCSVLYIHTNVLLEIHNKVFSPVRLVVTTQMYGDLVTETKHDAFVSRGKQYPKWSALIVVSCTFMLMYYLHEVPVSIDADVCA